MPARATQPSSDICTAAAGGTLRGKARVSTLTGMERKLATVLFVDLVDSTGLVTGADPEVVRRRVTQFFEKVSQCVTQHGGIVEKFAGTPSSPPSGFRRRTKTM